MRTDGSQIFVVNIETIGQYKQVFLVEVRPVLFCFILQFLPQFCIQVLVKEGVVIRIFKKYTYTQANDGRYEDEDSDRL